MGSQAELTMVAISEGSADCGQSVRRSASVSWRVEPAPSMVETSSRRCGIIQLEVAGPARWPPDLVPTAVGTYKYTDGEVLAS